MPSNWLLISCKLKRPGLVGKRSEEFFMLFPGTPAMTTRGCVESDFEIIANFLMRAVQIAENVQSEHGKLQKEFLKGLADNKEIIELRNNVEKFASAFEMPGFDIIPKRFSQ